MKRFIYGLAHLLYPRLCTGCGSPLHPGEQMLCAMCELLLPFTHYHHIPDNETALRLAGRIPFVHASSLAYFTAGGLLRHLIHKLKYQGGTACGRYLGEMLGHGIREQNWQVDIIVPVPIHKKKERIRGYNQSRYIAEGISHVLQIPVADKAVMRVKNTASQTDKSREERIANVADAFVVTQPEKLQHRHILLTDDVLTTGATLEACAFPLCNLPGTSISIVTVGIAMAI